VAEDTTDVFHILSPYAAYKMADEMLIYSYANCYDLNYLVFRLSNVYGRYDNDIERMTRVLHIFVDQMRRGEPVTIYGRSKMIDFTYVDDCVNGLMLGIDKLFTARWLMKPLTSAPAARLPWCTGRNHRRQPGCHLDDH